MKNAVIYYRQNKNESDDNTISKIKGFIKKFEKEFKIKEVVIDHYNNRSELYDFINTSPSNIEMIFLNTHLDEFDRALLNEISRVRKLNYNFDYNKT